MAVVLEIHSASYSSVVNTTGDALLAGVRCGACATTTLRLTGSRVHRRLTAAVGCTQLEVAVAKCSTCGRRERVLPFDVMPGKRVGVDVTFPAVRRVVTDGKSVASVAREHGVTRRTIRQWVAGVGTRALDLERLYHHRAQTAPRDAPAAGLLVRWAAVAVELARPATTTAPRFATDLRLTASQERVEAARHLVALLDCWGGACAAAAFGASLFRQAVLMFRAPTATRQVPPEGFAPVPGSRYRDRNSGTASTATGRPSDPIPSPQRRAQARSRTGVARRSAARAQRSVLDAAEHAALRGAEHAAPEESCLKWLVGAFMGCESQRAWSPTRTGTWEILPCPLKIREATPVTKTRLCVVAQPRRERTIEPSAVTAP